MGTNAGAIEDAYATGNVTGRIGDIGGLVGYNGDRGTIVDASYTTGTVTGTGGLNAGSAGWSDTTTG